jgi:hypothetical protein
LSSLAGKEPEIDFKQNRGIDRPTIEININKFQGQFGLEPLVNIDEGLHLTFAGVVNG